MSRRITKPVWVGGVKVGGDAPITVQSMTKTDTRDVNATVSQIKELEEAGCDIIRVAVPDMEAAKALKEIKRQIDIPLVADIHFHYQLALEALVVNQKSLWVHKMVLMASELGLVLVHRLPFSPKAREAPAPRRHSGSTACTVERLPCPRRCLARSSHTHSRLRRWDRL